MRINLTVGIDTLFMAMLIALTVYGAKFPHTSFPIYYVLLPLCVLYALNGIGREEFGEFFSENTRRTVWCWVLISLYAIILMPFTADNGINWNTIYYVFCLGISSYVYCYYMINHPDGIKIVLKCFFFISVLIALFGWYEAITGNIINKTAGSYFYRKNFLGLNYPNTIFYNINDHAVFMSFAFVIGMLYAEQSIHKKVIQILCWGLFVANVILVDSRGAEIFVVVFCTTFVLAYQKWKKAIMIMGFALVVILMISPVIMDTSLLSMVISESGRKEIWSNVFLNIKNSYFMGVGAGNSVRVNQLLNSSIISNVHSFFFEIFEDYGIVGFVLSLVWYIGAVINSYRIIHLNNEMRIVFAGLLGFFPLSIVSSSLVGKPCLIPFIAIITAVINYYQILYMYDDETEVAEE